MNTASRNWDPHAQLEVLHGNRTWLLRVREAGTDRHVEHVRVIAQTAREAFKAVSRRYADRIITVKTKLGSQRRRVIISRAFPAASN